MRFSHVSAAVAVVAVVALGAAWWVAASQGSPQPRAATATTHAKLQRELRRSLANRWPRLARGLPSGTGTCFVAGGSCSLKPCVSLIGQQQPVGTAVAISSAVALAPSVPRGQIHASGACKGRIGTPQTFRVSTRAR